MISKILNESLPKKEEFLLKAQALDSSRSITANIAEGFGRFHHQENIQFCRQSRGSLSEVMDHMITAFDDKYVNKETLAPGIQEMPGRIKWLYKVFKISKRIPVNIKQQNTIINNE